MAARRGDGSRRPSPGSILDGTSNTIILSAGSAATQYWLFVGTTPGGTELWNQNLGTATSTTVTGLPLNGSTLYFRLWSLVGGSWVFNEYQYRAGP